MNEQILSDRQLYISTLCLMALIPLASNQAGNDWYNAHDFPYSC
jgi:hypothetical protein